MGVSEGGDLWMEEGGGVHVEAVDSLLSKDRSLGQLRSPEGLDAACTPNVQEPHR